MSSTILIVPALVAAQRQARDPCPRLARALYARPCVQRAPLLTARRVNSHLTPTEGSEVRSEIQESMKVEALPEPGLRGAHSLATKCSRATGGRERDPRKARREWLAHYRTRTSREGLNMAAYKKLRLEQIAVDDRYQRPLTPARIEKIVKNFDQRQLGVLEVSQRNGAGSYNVFDGQHRLAALRKLGHKDAPCLVHKLSAEEEAELFVRLQRDRKAISPVERFRAQVFYSDPQAVAINEILTRHGFIVSSSSEPKYVRAISAVEGVYNREGEQGLGDTMNLIRSLWYGDDRSTDGYFVAGVAEFLRGYKNRIGEKERQRLVAAAPTVILRRALGPMSGGGAMHQRHAVAAELRRIAGVRGRPTGAVKRKDETS